MKITCPKNPAHLRFSVTAHVAEDWLVDEDGNYLEKLEGNEQVIHEPDSGDMYVCMECSPVEEVIGVVTR